MGRRVRNGPVSGSESGCRHVASTLTAQRTSASATGCSSTSAVTSARHCPAVVLDVRERQRVVELETFLIRSNVYLPPSVVPGQTVQLELQEVDTWRGQARYRHMG